MLYTMPIVSVRISEELKERMDAHEAVNWSAIMRTHLEREVAARERTDLGSAIATSERLSRDADGPGVGETDSAAIVRRFREARRRGPE